MSKEHTRRIIIALGKKLGFQAKIEVMAATSAYVDVVWFDDRFSFRHRHDITTPEIRRDPLLPVVGFEIEQSTANNPKHVKGSVANLNNLGAIMSIIVLGKENLGILRKTTKIHQKENDEKLWRHIIQKVSSWVYAEAQPRTRTVIMKEDEIIDWAKSEGVVVEENLLKTSEPK